MERKFLEVLNNWNNNPQKKPLIVYGARQVGKTYTISQFLKDNYENYLIIDLLVDEKLIEIYKENITKEKRFERIQLEYNFSFDDTIIFIDEVQKCLGIIEDLKYLKILYPNIKIIVAGSLLGVSYRNNSDISMPVGYVDVEYMYALDFEEFLNVTNNKRYIPLIMESYRNNECLPDTIHSELLELYYDYLYIGGMPEIVQNYLDNDKKIISINRKIIKNIIDIYKEDMSKYIKNIQERIRIERIYDNIIPQLSKENPKFTFAKINEKDNRKRDYISALDWLIKSYIIFDCNQVYKCEYPLNFYKDTESYKLFLNDTGIMCSLGNISPFNVDMSGDYQAKGILAENYVAIELKKYGYDLLYFSKKSVNIQSMEIDFLIQIENNVIPIEVKAGTNNQSKSLNSYINEYNPPYAIRISSKNFGFENNIKSVPLYAVFCIKNNE